jgi:hypothetical protein
MLFSLSLKNNFSLLSLHSTLQHHHDANAAAAAVGSL